MIENIDIGGPTMIRAAAKNFAFTAVVVNPASYDAVLQELTDAGGKLSLGTRESLAAEAFSYTARYDSAISRWFVEKQDDFPPLLLNAYEKVTDLALRREPAPARRLLRRRPARACTCSRWSASSAARSCRSTTCSTSTPRACSTQEFELPACAIIKHNNPCGVAVGGSVARGLRRAPSRATRCRPSAASSASTARSTRRSPRRC